MWSLRLVGHLSCRPRPSWRDACCFGNPGDQVPEERDELLRWKVEGTARAGESGMMEAKERLDLKIKYLTELEEVER